MEQQAEFKRLFEAMQGGSDEAVRQFLDRYGGVIRHVIRERLDDRLRSKFDSADFMQDMWASFYRCPPPDTLDGPKALFRYLLTVARRKVVDAVRERLVSPRRTVAREIPHEETATDHLACAQARQPTPSQEFVARELWERAVRGRTDLQVRILAMLRDGHSYEEISQTLGLSIKRVQRLVRKVSQGFHA